jgi:hypothetical protein
MRRSLPAPDDPAVTALLDCHIDQTVPREATPSLEIDTDARPGADDGDEVARTCTAQRRNQLGQQAGRKRPCTSVKLKVRFHWHALHYTVFVLLESKMF